MTDAPGTAGSTRKTLPPLKIALRVTAGALAVMMLLSVLLLHATRIVQPGDGAALESAANRAFKALVKEDGYLNASAVKRVELFLSTIGKKSDTPEACQQLAAIYAGRGEYEEAAILFAKGIALNTTQDKDALAEQYLRLGSAYVLAGGYADARAAFEQAIGYAPDATLPRLLLAQTALEMENYALAAEQMRYYLLLEPLDYENRRMLAGIYLNMGEYQNAFRGYAAVFQFTGAAEDCLLAARAALLAGDQENGVNYLTRYLTDNDDPDGSLHYLRSIAYLWQARYDEAKADLLAALSNGYEQPADIYMNLTICTHMTQDYAGTLEYGRLARACWSAPDGECLQRMGIAAMQLGELENAMAFLQESSAANAALKENDYFIATAHLQKGDYQTAAEAYAKAIANGVQTQECYYNRAICLLQLQQYEAAVNDLIACLTAGDDATLIEASNQFLSQLGISATPKNAERRSTDASPSTLSGLN